MGKKIYLNSVYTLARKAYTRNKSLKMMKKYTRYVNRCSVEAIQPMYFYKYDSDSNNTIDVLAGNNFSMFGLKSIPQNVFRRMYRSYYPFFHYYAKNDIIINMKNYSNTSASFKYMKSYISTL